jgi:hypothetical protein
MRKLSKSLILGIVLALIALPLFHAQTAANATADTSAAQAPDEVTNKITELFHAGKYVEAQQLTTGMLLAYPNDQRLIKTKALLDKLLTPGAGTATQANEKPVEKVAPAQPPTNTDAEQLTGMDKVDYNALIVLARQAQQTTDLDEQEKLLHQFVVQSAPFLQKHPDLMLLWKFRVVSAIDLNEPMAGYEAGQKLLAMGAADSNDPALQQLLAQLKNKGWLDKQGAEEAQEYIRLRSLKLSLVYGTWSNKMSFHYSTTMTVTVGELGDMKEPVGIRLENGSPKTCRLDGGATGTFTIDPGNVVGGTYTTNRRLTLLSYSTSNYEKPCTVNLSIVDKTGKEISRVTRNNGY